MYFTITECLHLTFTQIHRFCLFLVGKSEKTRIFYRVIKTKVINYQWLPCSSKRKLSSGFD